MEHLYHISRFKNDRWEYLGCTDSFVFFCDLIMLYSTDLKDTIFQQGESVNGKNNGVRFFWKNGKRYKSTEGLK